MKRALGILLSLLITLGMFSGFRLTFVSAEEADEPKTKVNKETYFKELASIGADTDKCGEDDYWSLSDDGVLSITGNGGMYGNSNYYDSPWYDRRSEIKEVIISDGITDIDNYAFNYCTSLENITIPDSVTCIGYYAFEGCESLESITIPDGVTSIYGGAFYGCTSLESITIPASITSIDGYVFKDCTSLERVYISDVAAWCNIDFEEYDSNPLYYADNLYLNGELVKDIVIPQGVVSIPFYAFYCCTSLEGIEIPNSVTSIGSYAFCGCISLEDIEIPDSVTHIGYSAFEGCESLESIVISNSVTSIGSSAFEDCESLENVYISDVAAWCNIDYDYYDYYSHPLYYAANLYLNGELVKDIVIPQGVISIPKYAFSCSSLESITIPDSVTSISESAFENCKSLESITIPDGVTNINQETFRGCISLESITIPDSVTNIDIEAFRNCTSLESITIPDSVLSIGMLAFYECTSLEHVTIPNSVTSIGSSAFEGCESLESITISDSVTNIGDEAFIGTAYYDDGNKWIDGVLYIDNALVDVDETLSGKCIIRKGTMVVSESAFEDCTNLESIIIPDGVISIDRCTFYGCTSLENITIPDSITSIDFNSFLECSTLCHVFYSGSEDQWDNIDILSGNDDLTNANIHYNTTGPIEDTTVSTEPAEDVTVVTEPTEAPEPTEAVTTIAATVVETEATEVTGSTGADKSDPTETTDPAKVIIDKKTQISVETHEDIDATLKVVEISDNKQIEEVNLVLVGEKVSKLYDITFDKDGATVQPDGKVTVRIPADSKNCNVYRVETDGTLTDMNAEFVDGYLEFTTEHFSLYVVTEKVNATSEDNTTLSTEPSIGGEIEGTEPATGATEPEGTSTPDETKPSTGDDTKPSDATEPSTGDDTKPSEPSEDKGLLGDVNSDGKINIKDVTQIQKAAAKLLELTESESLCADVTADTKVNIKDATAIQKFVAKIETGFPIGKLIS